MLHASAVSTGRGRLENVQDALLGVLNEEAATSNPACKTDNFFIDSSTRY